jgi:hypothetical protein
MVFDVDTNEGRYGHIIWQKKFAGANSVPVFHAMEY